VLRALASFALVLACGCGNHFVEPHPPQLERAQATYTAGSAGEPTSYLVVLDLYLERSAGCADQHAFALQTIRAAMGPEAIEIAVEDASPTCAQLSTRSIDPLAVDTAIVAAQAAHAAAHLRPILVYVNNIDLPITHPLIDQLAAIRSRSVARVQQAPLYWALAAAKPAGDLRSDRIVPWTFTGDAALGATLRSLASADLPLQSETGDVAGPLPLLGEDALHRAQRVGLRRAPWIRRRRQRAARRSAEAARFLRRAAAALRHPALGIQAPRDHASHRALPSPLRSVLRLSAWR